MIAHLAVFIFYAPSVRRSLPKEWQFSHVHARTADFVSRRPLCGELRFRSTLRSIARSVTHKAFGAVRFLLWWLFLHRRLRSRQRGSFSPFGSIERLSHLLGRSFPAGVVGFYPDHSVCLAADFSKPFGFGFGRTRRRLSAPSVLRL